MIKMLWNFLALCLSAVDFLVINQQQSELEREQLVLTIGGHFVLIFLDTVYSIFEVE